MDLTVCSVGGGGAWHMGKRSAGWGKDKEGLGLIGTPTASMHLPGKAGFNSFLSEKSTHQCGSSFSKSLSIPGATCILLFPSRAQSS